MMTRTAFGVAVLALIGNSMSAHAPGLSSIELNIDREGLAASADFSLEDWKLIENASELFRMRVDGRSAMPVERSVTKQLSGDAEVVRVTYRFPLGVSWTKLAITARFLDLLPPGHWTFLTARYNTKPFDEGLLNTQRPAFEIDRSSASQGQ